MYYIKIDVIFIMNVVDADTDFHNDDSNKLYIFI